MMQKSIIRLFYAFLFGYIVLIAYITYIQVFEAPKFVDHPANRRVMLRQNQLERGEILDRNGVVLAKDVIDAGNTKRRFYPLGSTFAHTVGYQSIRFGRTGLEVGINDILSGRWGLQEFVNAANHYLGKPAQGLTAVLTLDANLQKLAYDMLGARKGAVVVINPKNGEVLALVSNPSFDPNQLNTNWSQLYNNPNSPLLNRATQGLYPPGSSFKPLIALAALQENSMRATETFDCPGKVNVNGYVISDPANEIHGKIAMSDALAVSCNVYFTKLILSLGKEKYLDYVKKAGFMLSIPFALPVVKNRFPKLNELSEVKLAANGIGQDEILVSPFQMALFAAGIANKGIIEKPMLVKEIRKINGKKVAAFEPETLLSFASPESTYQLTKMMESVVTSGTGKKASIDNISVAGKTGTAQNPHGDSHSWFIGFAPVDDPAVALAVIVENGGSGGEVAAPIARELFRQALQKNNQ